MFIDKKPKYATCTICNDTWELDAQTKTSKNNPWNDLKDDAEVKKRFKLGISVKSATCSG